MLGTFFFEDDEEVAVYINGERYRDMLSPQLWPKFKVKDIDDLWFQEKEATEHAYVVRNFSDLAWQQTMVTKIDSYGNL